MPRQIFDGLNYRVEEVAKDGTLIEVLAMAGNFTVAKAAFEAAKLERPNSVLHLVNRARVIEKWPE